jgi:hypothetical protein
MADDAEVFGQDDELPAWADETDDIPEELDGLDDEGLDELPG